MESGWDSKTDAGTCELPRSKTLRNYRDSWEVREVLDCASRSGALAAGMKSATWKALR